MSRTFDGDEIDRAVHSTNYTEFTVKKKAEGNLLLQRIGMLAFYAAVIVLGVFLLSKFWYIAFLIFLGIIILCFFTWPYVNVEYEYVTSSGELTFTKILGGGKSRKELLKLKIKDMEIIAPYTDEYASKYSDIKKKYDYRRSVKQTEDVYFAVFTNGGEKSMVLFQCTAKALKIFGTYNKENTVHVDTLRY